MPEPRTQHEDPNESATRPDEGEAVAPPADGRADGGPASHTEGETGGATNDTASGGTPEGADGD